VVGLVQPFSVQSLARLVALRSSWRDFSLSLRHSFLPVIVGVSVLPVIAGSMSVLATFLLRVYSTLVCCCNLTQLSPLVVVAGQRRHGY
jgi:hypothetical protein